MTYTDAEVLEQYKDCEKAYDNGVYDFTFENRYIIYHANIRNRTEYLALDMKTGLASQVSTYGKTKQYTPCSYHRLIPEILYSIKYNGDMRYIDAMIDEPLEIIDSIFRVILANNGYNIREEQIALAKKMYIGFTDKQIAICEAEVGTGKTLSYLVAAVVARQHHKREHNINLPVTITTSSIELQKAIVEKEIPNLSNLLCNYGLIDRPLTAVLRKGKEHFFCLYRYNDLFENISMYPQKYSDTIHTLRSMNVWKNGIDLDKYNISNALKNKICVKGSCKGCSMKDECVYLNYIKKMYAMPNLDFQVTNHNLYLMSHKKMSVDGVPLLTPSCFVVIDEAHKLKEAAEETFGERLSENDILKYIKAIKTLCAKEDSKKKYSDMLSQLEKINCTFFKRMRKQFSDTDADEEKGNLVKLTPTQIGAIDEIVTLITEIENLKVRRNYGIPITANLIISALSALRKPNNQLSWLEADENDVLSLCCIPKNVAVSLREVVWKTEASHVLTSGTMSDGVDFEYFKHEIGLDRISKHLILESKTESPFDYKNNSRLYIPNNIPMPDNADAEYIGAVANETLKIINATNGHTAILFTSYKVLSAVYEILESQLGSFELFKMTRGNKTVISDFKNSKNGILFASGSMWEGVDCVGDCLSSVIIVRLPFPRRSVLMEEKKGDCTNVREFVDKYCTPNMLIKLRQGVGRLIRCETDTGVVSILDPRANSKAYSVKVGNALSKYPKVRNVKEIETFIREVKDEAYFQVGDDE